MSEKSTPTTFAPLSAVGSVSCYSLRPLTRSTTLARGAPRVLSARAGRGDGIGPGLSLPGERESLASIPPRDGSASSHVQPPNPTICQAHARRWGRKANVQHSCPGAEGTACGHTVMIHPGKE